MSKDEFKRIRDKFDTEHSINRIVEIIYAGLFDSSNKHIWRQSAFIELMILLRDILQKCEKYSTRVDFTDDVLINGYVKDVTDLITAIRDACCHIDSFKRNFDENGNTGSHNIIYGKGIALNIDGLVLGSDYEDEIAYIYGKNRIYVRRHIIRAFEEAKLKLNEFLK